MKSVIAKYRAIAKLCKRYWAAYGGWPELLRSPYFHVSLVATAASYGTWLSPEWVAKPVGVLPNLLGFSLGALTIFIGFGSEQFRELISGREGDKQSPYMGATTTFVHFILVQCAALFVALILDALTKASLPSWAAATPVIVEVNKWLVIASWFFGYWMFLYAVVLSVSAVLSVFRVAGWFDDFRTKQRAAEKSKDAPPQIIP